MLSATWLPWDCFESVDIRASAVLVYICMRPIICLGWPRTKQYSEKNVAWLINLRVAHWSEIHRTDALSCWDQLCGISVVLKIKVRESSTFKVHICCTYIYDSTMLTWRDRWQAGNFVAVSLFRSLVQPGFRGRPFVSVIIDLSDVCSHLNLYSVL